MKTKILLTALALAAMTTLASAQNPNAGRCCGRGPCGGTGKGVQYVDANKDGVCDNNAANPAKKGGNRGNGTCNGAGPGKGKGRNFVDANQNGICDQFEARTKK